MSIGRRSFLQLGVGAALATVAHGCTHSRSTGNANVSKELLEQINQRGYLLVATEDYYPPFEFLVNDKPTGMDHDLLARLRKVSPFEIRQEILPWKGLLPGVGEGTYDVAITAAIITDERAQYLDFTIPIAETTLVYLKRKGDSSIQNVFDLSGKALGVQKGGASFDILDEFKAKLQRAGGEMGPVKQYGSFAEAYRDLNNQQIDAVIHNIVSLSLLVNEKPGLFEVGQPVSPRSYAAWAVKKGNQPLVTYLNQFLMSMRDSGELTRLQQQWLKVTFDKLPTEPLLPGDRPIS